MILAEDSFILREGLRELLATRTAIEVVDVCRDLDALLEAVDAERPDVVITDIRMPPTNTDEGIQAAARLRDSHPHIGVVVLSQYSDPSYVLALLESGSDGRAFPGVPGACAIPWLFNCPMMVSSAARASEFTGSISRTRS